MTGDGSASPQPSQTPEALDLTILIPTLDEAGNIGRVLARLAQVLSGSPLRWEAIVVDDASRDGTQEEVRAQASVRLLVREEPRGGLTGAICAGARLARGRVVVVMDADGSHPPEIVPRLAERVLNGECDVAIGSRYVRGGSTSGWPIGRRLVSRFAGLLSAPLVDVRDPLSGFFATTRERLLRVPADASGFKIGLEVLLLEGPAPRVEEIPIHFLDRVAGVSKLGPRVVLSYVARLFTLAGGRLPPAALARFLAVGLFGMLLDAASCQLLRSAGTSLSLAHVSSFSLATVFTFALDARFAYRTSLSLAGGLRLVRQWILSLSLRVGVLQMSSLLGLPELTGLCCAVITGAALNHLGFVFQVFAPSTGGDRARRFRVAALGLVLYLLAARLVYAALLEVLPEEAYYWNYSQHLDIGYLDHPPLTAWLIALATGWLGDNEFAVRIPAILCWGVAAWFLFRQTSELHGKTAAWIALGALSCLPYFFGAGFFMTPDAPLVACWAASLYFLRRALLQGRARGWLAAGVALGLGLLSKYSIALLVPAALVYVLLDARSRRWLATPWPYLGLAAALLLFTPVVLWNAENDWASFRFQSVGRWEGESSMHLQDLLLGILVLIFPVVPLLLGLVLERRARGREAPSVESSLRFAAAFTLVPLLPFLLYSLLHKPRMNWTGPIWLAALPACAAAFAALPGRSRAWNRAAKVSTAAVSICCVFFALALQYLTLGVPGLPYPSAITRILGWRDLGRQIEDLEQQHEVASGRESRIVGWGKYALASELAFYQRGEPFFDGDTEGFEEVSNHHMFGGKGLMYRYWFPTDLFEGKDLLLVSRSRSDLDRRVIEENARSLGPIQELTVHSRLGVPLGSFFVRRVYDYSAHRAAGGG